MEPTFGVTTSERAASSTFRKGSAATVAMWLLLSTTPLCAAPFAYVVNVGSSDVTVIDTATNTVTATVALPVSSNPQDVAIAHDGTRAYTANYSTNNVSVIDTATESVIVTVPVGFHPYGIAIAPDDTSVYVTNNDSHDVSIIDTATNTVIATVPVGINPLLMAFTPNGAFAYVSNSSSNDVSVINTATNTVTATVPVGTNPEGIAITPDGALAYITNYGSSNISVIDTATNAVATTINVGVFPYGIAITPDGTRAYITTNGSTDVDVLDIATNTVVMTVPLGGTNTYGIEITPDGAHVYAVRPSSNDVAVIDTTTNTVTATVGAGFFPYNLAIGPATADDDDDDDDGIADTVDAAPSTPSDSFDDGNGTSGVLTDRAGLTVTITDAASPDGVRVEVTAGSGQITIDACGFTETVDAGSEAIITCGSITLSVIQGSAEVVLNDGRLTVVSVTAGATAAVTDNGDGTVLVQNVGSVGAISVTVEGEQTTLNPGDSQTHTVVYAFDGFFSPVDALPTLNSAKAGSAIPVKFSLGGNHGLGIFAAGYPTSQKMSCDTSAPLDPVEETVSASSSSLSYDANADQYRYIWKTDKAWFGTCRQLTLRLDDATNHVATFKFK